MNAIVYQLSGDGHRGTAAVRRLVEHAPSTGALALWMQHRDVDVHPHDPFRVLQSPVANDGLTLTYLASMERLPLRTQTGLVAHHVLHVALRHVARRDALAQRIGNVDARLWNGAADAIVNASLVNHDWLDLPEGSVRIDELLRRTLSIDDSLESSLQRWDVESLYRAIDDRTEPRGAGSGSQRDPRDERTASDAQQRSAASAAVSSHHAPDQRLEQRDGPRAAAARELFRSMLADLAPGQQQCAESAAQDERQWRERLGRAHAADGFQSLLRVLGADTRPGRTAWQPYLRTRLARALSPEPDRSWSRPSRSWLANRGRTSSGRRLPWEPGITSQRAVPLLVVVVDVSGSIDNEQLLRFAREVARVQRVYRAELWLIAGDDRVRCERLVRVGQQVFDALPVAGGNGTDFRPLLAAAARHRPDLIIVLGDLHGPAGDAPAFEVLWATPRDSDACTPFGTRLWLD